MLPPPAAAALPPTLRSYVRSNLQTLRRSPCLVVSSSPPESSSSGFFDPAVDAHVKRSSFALTSEFNLRAVSCTVSSAFPTERDVNAAVDLARRAGLKPGRNSNFDAGGGGGEGTVIGIGSGPAIDLAKAVADTLFGNVSAGDDGHGAAFNNDNDDEVGRLVLAPATFGGLWAARSDAPALLLDTHEEAILPHLPPAWNGNDALFQRRTGTAVTMEDLDSLSLPPLLRSSSDAGIPQTDGHGPPTVAHVAAATLAVIIDIARSLDDGKVTMPSGEFAERAREELSAAASHATAALRLAADHHHSTNNNIKNNEETQTIVCRHAGEAIARGGTFAALSGAAGTVPQSLTYALLPKYFPGCHAWTLVASTLPGICGSIAAASRRGSDDLWKGAIVRAVFAEETDGGGETEPTLDDLAAWSTEVAIRAGLPSMADIMLGDGKTRPEAFVGSLDAYETLVGNRAWGASGEDRWVLEDVLQRCLDR